MRILLDAKDLIDVVEHGLPVTAQQFDSWLRAIGASVVLSFTNVNDFVGPAFENNTFLDIRVLLQRIERMPLRYIREGTIAMNELREALDAYRDQREPNPIDPFVNRWDDTGFWLNESAANILVGMRLDDLVYMARSSIQVYKRFNPGIKKYLEEEHAIPVSERWTIKEIFIRRMPDRVAAYNLDARGVDVGKFATWLWQNPVRCPGLRLSFEAHHMRMRDKSRPFEDGDIADYAHISALPYVDVATVDKRIGNLLKAVFRKLRANHPKVDLSDRVFINVSELMKRHAP